VGATANWRLSYKASALPCCSTLVQWSKLQENLGEVVSERRTIIGFAAARYDGRGGGDDKWNTGSRQIICTYVSQITINSILTVSTSQTRCPSWQPKQQCQNIERCKLFYEPSIKSNHVEIFGGVRMYPLHPPLISKNKIL